MEEGRVVDTLKKIKQQQQGKIKPLAPIYFFFSYLGYRCYVMKCLHVNSTWVGLVEIRPKKKRLVWPKDAQRKRPFGNVGIDFDFELDGNHYLGFHTNHLNNMRGLAGVYFDQSGDYVALQLKNFIKTSR